MVAAVIATVEPEVTATVFRIRSHVAVPTEPWAMTVPALWVRMRKCEAVPVLSALVSELIAPAVNTDGFAVVVAENITDEQVSCASTLPVIAASAVAGIDPS